MVLRTLGCSTFFALFIMCFAPFATAFAQNSSPEVKSDASSGITATISKIIVNQAKVNIQFVITNNTKGRVYIEDVSGDQNQLGFLGSGYQFNNHPQVLGLEQCTGTVSECTSAESSENDIDNYSYIEPGEFLSCMFTYQADSPVSNNDTLSFSMVLMAKFSTPDTDPTQAGSVNILRFNFPFVPLS
jgi:hypothetical protein